MSRDERGIAVSSSRAIVSRNSLSSSSSASSHPTRFARCSLFRALNTMANTNAPATSHTQPPPPAGAQSQLGPFARFQRWLKQSDTLEERLFVASVLLYILLIPLAPLLWCAGVALFLYILYIYFLVPFFLILTLYSWGYLTIKIPYLPPRFQRVIDALLLPHAAWSLAQLAMPNLVRPIATGVDLWLKYLAVTALFDVHVLPRLLNTAVELERCLQKTQETAQQSAHKLERESVAVPSRTVTLPPRLAAPCPLPHTQRFATRGGMGQTAPKASAPPASAPAKAPEPATPVPASVTSSPTAGFFSRILRWLEQYNTVEQRWHAVLTCSEIFTNGKAEGDSELLAVLFCPLIPLAIIAGLFRIVDPGAITDVVGGVVSYEHWKNFGVPLAAAIEWAAGTLLHYLVFVPLAWIIWSVGAAIPGALFFVYGVVPLSLLISAYCLGNFALPCLPFLPLPFQRVLNALAFPYIVWKALERFAALVPYKANAYLFLFYVAFTAFFDIAPLWDLLAAAAERETKAAQLAAVKDSAAKATDEGAKSCGAADVKANKADPAATKPHTAGRQDASTSSAPCALPLQHPAVSSFLVALCTSKSRLRSVSFVLHTACKVSERLRKTSEEKVREGCDWSRFRPEIANESRLPLRPSPSSLALTAVSRSLRPLERETTAMAGSYAQTDAAPATSASNSDDAVSPPAEQGVGYALRLKRWLERSNTMEKRTEAVYCLDRVPLGPLALCLMSSSATLWGLTLMFVICWYQDPDFREEVHVRSWDEVTSILQDSLRRGVLFLLDKVILPQIPTLCALVFGPLAAWFAYCAVGIPAILLCSAYSFGRLTFPSPFTGPSALQRVWDAALVPFVAWRLLVLLEPLAPLSPYANTLILYLAATAYFDVHPLARLLDLAVELEQVPKSGKLEKDGDVAVKERKQGWAESIENFEMLRELERENTLLKEILARRSRESPQAKT
ncbi:Proteophosphoglycan ppg4 [Rhodotorula toruloides ATCC 204091]|uniref:Proteophosphoglycan ppg4 n=1 Tax=Rhodotorula toruloides TaxID=5286 RepID=A0A0K3CAH0_RHOTO|nr:Proteophosphoglycan ppg4 [Rhodotorula toruloides ATCC 204091]PRQ75914.1 Proteophosphoglycan ppg4 [Rhodotorula toruloides]